MKTEQDKTTHTPGPWRAGGMGMVVDLNQDGIALTSVSKPSMECEANARLIAAAPELLKALKAMVWTFEKLGNGKAITQARTAIAKAEVRE
jgi:hypothetical protein